MISPHRAIRFSRISTGGATPQTSDLKFVDEKFEVIPAPAHIRQPGEDAAGPADPTSGEPGIRPSSVDYSEDDLMFMTETIWSLPQLVFEKLPDRDPEKLRKWNNQLYRYCMKKGIDPFAWFFDELPLAIATIGLAGGTYRDYKEAYPKNKDIRSKEDKKLSSDYDHEKEIAEKKELDIKAGVISSAQPPAS
jgi:hypothetical protein